MFFFLRQANLADAENIFNLSNDATVRENSINKNKIIWDNHLQWLAKKINDKNYIFYIIEDINKKFIGQLRYTINSYEATVSISLDINYRNKGLSSKILIEGNKKMISEDVNKILAYIRAENKASRKTFEKAGYNFLEQKYINNEIFCLYIYQEKIN